MHQQDIIEIHKGLQKAYIDNAVNSNLAYSPQFITNDYKRGVKILTHIENQLMHCDEFSISVAFINRSGFVNIFVHFRKSHALVSCLVLRVVFPFVDFKIIDFVFEICPNAKT